MNKNDKDFMNQLNNLDDFSVEEIAENYPALYGNTKKRILKKCLKKDGFSAEIESDGKEAIIISGTERYKRRPWYRFAASAAAFVLAVGGITSVFMLNRNLNGNDISETEKTSVLSIHDSWSDNKSNKTTATAPNSVNASSSYDSSSAIESWDTNSKDDTITTSDNGNGSLGYWGTNDNETSQTPTTANESPINNTVSFNSVSLNETRWSEEEIGGSWKHAIEFSNDGFSGHYVIPSENLVTTNSTLIYFTYTQNGDEIIFYIGFDTATGKVRSSNNDPRGEVMLTLVWADGRTEYFYTRNIEITSDGSLKYSLPYDDGYSARPPIADTTLNGTKWCEHELDGPVENFIDFGNDGFSGHYGTTPESYETADAELIYLTYTKNGNDIIFYIGSDIVTGKLSSSNNDPRGEVMLTLVWANGLTEYLYNNNFPITALQN